MIIRHRLIKLHAAARVVRRKRTHSGRAGSLLRLDQRAGIREADDVRGFGRVRSFGRVNRVRSVRRDARAHEQAHAQEHDCAEDERENTFFHVFVLLSQGVGIGSICVREVLASTVPTCCHTFLTSLAAYFSRFAVWTASAVT